MILQWVFTASLTFNIAFEFIYDKYSAVYFGGALALSILCGEAFKHPYISFFHLLVNGFSVTSNEKVGRTLSVGLACTAPPTNTNFWLTFLLTRPLEALYEDLPV